MIDRARTLALAFALSLGLHAVRGDAQPAPAAPLRMHFVTGQRVPYVTTTVQTMNSAVGRMEIHTRAETETARVNPDGTALQRMRVTAVDVVGANLPTSVRQRLTSALSGVSLEFTQDARGQVTNAHPVGEVTPEIRPVVESLTQTVDQMSPQLPEPPVRVGDSWTTHREVRLNPNAGGALRMQYEVRNTLRELRAAPAPAAPPRPGTQRPAGGSARNASVGPVAVIDSEITIATPAGSNASGVPITGSGSATGAMTLDLGRGVVERSSSHGTLRLHLDVAGRAIDVDTRFENDMHAE